MDATASNARAPERGQRNRRDLSRRRCHEGRRRGALGFLHVRDGQFPVIRAPRPAGNEIHVDATAQPWREHGQRADTPQIGR
ncbi:MAG: hypothetical protein WDN25_30015 [Acetobacteraceae bacterium]